MSDNFDCQNVAHCFVHIEHKMDIIERQIESLRKDVSDLQKSDSKQMMILIILVSGLLGLDLTKVSLIFHDLSNQPQPSLQNQRYSYEFLTSFNYPERQFYLGRGAAPRGETA